MGWGALRLGALAVPAAAAIGGWLRGAEGAAGAAIGVAIVVANFAVAAAVSALAGRRTAYAAAFVGLPSYAIRMLVILGTMAALQGRAFLDRSAFAVGFGAAVAAVLAYECVLWARTPWAGLAFGKEQP